MKFIFLFIFLSANSLAADCSSEKIVSEYKPLYAKLFKITYFKDFKIIESKKDKFIVADKKLACTTNLFTFTSNTLRFVATSTTHLPFLSEFSLEKNLVGFQGVRYIYNSKLNENSIKDIHYQLNAEELISLKPDLVMAYTANLSSLERVTELRKAGIPLVLNYDFEERHPLARAEWLVFSAAFFSKDLEAQRLFKSIEVGYQRVKDKAKSFPLKKNVLIGDIQNGKWVTCGGSSDLAILIKDAGGELYLKSTAFETQTLSLEKIYQIKEAPALWLSQNTWQSKAEMKKDSRYKRFFALALFNNNTLLNAQGFNDYWETGLMRPDLLLSDLFNIFHMDKIPKADLVWYKELK
jgi:iron complex transport system substrate-binding protein